MVFQSWVSYQTSKTVPEHSLYIALLRYFLVSEILSFGIRQISVVSGKRSLFHVGIQSETSAHWGNFLSKLTIKLAKGKISNLEDRVALRPD